MVKNRKRNKKIVEKFSLKTSIFTFPFFILSNGHEEELVEALLHSEFLHLHVEYKKCMEMDRKWAIWSFSTMLKIA